VTNFVDAKLAALLQHKSQLRSTMGIGGPDALENGEHPEVLDFKRRITTRLGDMGKDGGFAAAEAFKRIDNL
jgi:hypothetical protein